MDRPYTFTLRVMALAACLAAFPMMHAGSAEQDHPRALQGIPHDKRDSGLQGEHATEARQKAALLAAITSHDCPTPSFTYSTTALEAAIGSSLEQESEIWYFQCPELAPVLVHYWPQKDGGVDRIHVHEFETFYRELPFPPLALQPKAVAGPASTPSRLHEAMCFGILAERLEDRLKKVSRVATAGEGRRDRAMCLRARACNSIDPAHDLFQDIALEDKADRDGIAGFISWCNRQELRILAASEPELTYALIRLLPHVPALTEREERRQPESRRKQ